MGNLFNILPLSLLLLVTLSACTSNKDVPEEILPDTSTMEPEDNLVELPGQEILGDDVIGGLDGDYDHTLDEDFHLEWEDDHTHDDTQIGVPYDEMVENGQVHDEDGDLTDGENHQSDLIS